MGDLVPMEDEENVNSNSGTSSVTSAPLQAPSLFTACTSNPSLYSSKHITSMNAGSQSTSSDFSGEQQRADSSAVGTSAAAAASAAGSGGAESEPRTLIQPAADTAASLEVTAASKCVGRPQQGHVDGQLDIAVRPHMCFSLAAGRVTSLACTPDGLYCVAAFANGEVRLYDMSVDGNTDPEDRFGYRIGYLESPTMALNIHLELAVSRDASSGGVICSHLFIGARQGASSVLVVDVTALRRLHQKRGFVSVAGGALQVFQHADVQLRGLTSVAPISDGSGTAITSSTAEKHSFSVAGTYSTAYRLICGRGLCSYHIWEARFEALLKGSVSGGSSPGVSSGCSPSGADITYRQQWVHLAQANVNSPIMTFAHYISHAGGAYGALDSSLDGAVEGAAQRHMEIIVSGDGKEARAVHFQGAAADAEAQFHSDKPINIKKAANLYAASADGTILFGGTYELVVSRYATRATVACGEAHAEQHGSQIVAQSTFSLTDFVIDAVDAGDAKKSSRHLREICDVTCTPDGAYALVCCSDNAILLYRCGPSNCTALCMQSYIIVVHILI